MIRLPSEKMHEGSFEAELMMSLTADQVEMLHEEFSSRGEEGLTLPQFCFVMKTVLFRSSIDNGARMKRASASPFVPNARFMPPPQKVLTKMLRMMPEKMLVEKLTEFFVTVDLDGNGKLDWDEFTSHMVERVMASQDQKPDSIQAYTPGVTKEMSKRCTSFVKKVAYFKGNDSIVAFDYDSPEFRVYTSHHLELKLTVVRPEGFIVAVDYMENHQYVVSSSDRRLSAYDDSTGVLCRTIRTPTMQVCLRWIETHVMLYSADVTGTIRAWDGMTFKEKFKVLPVALSVLAQLDGESGATAQHLPPPDGNESVCDGGDERSTSEWSSAWDREGFNYSMVARDESPRPSDFRAVLCMIELTGLEILATSSIDANISLWDLQTGKLKRCLKGHSKGVTSLGFSSAYRFLVSGGFDFDIVIWNPYVEHYILRLPGHNNAICGIQLVDNTPQLVTADCGGEVLVWDVRNFACVQRIKIVDEKEQSEFESFVSVAPRKQLLAVSRRKMYVYQYQHVDHPHLTDDTPVFSVLYNVTTLTIMTASMHHVRVWDMQTGALVRVCRALEESTKCELTAICLDKGQRKFLVGDHDGNVRAFNYMNGDELLRFVPSSSSTQRRAHTTEVSRILPLDEYGLFLTASWDGSLKVFDDVEDEDGMLLRVMSGGHSNDVSTIAFSLHLSLIASGSSDGKVCIWNFELGTLLGTCDQVAAVTAMAFVEPYPALLVADANGTFHMWATPPSPRALECLAAWQVYSPFSGVTQSRYGSVLCFEVVPQFVAEARYTFNTESSSSDDSSSCTESSSNSSSSSSSSEATSSSGADSRVEMERAHISRILLIAGDDTGSVTIWDIKPLISCLSSESFKRVSSRVVCNNPRRNVRYEARRASNSGTAKKSLWHGDSQETTTSRIVKTCELEQGKLLHLSAFSAHSDSIISLRYVANTSTIITSSMDLLVRLWNEVGTCLGTLRQGNKAEFLYQSSGTSNTEKWSYRASDSSETKRKSSQLRETLDSLHELERDERAAAEAARAAMPQYMMNMNQTQLKRFSDGQLHYVFSQEQLNGSSAQLEREDDEQRSLPDGAIRDSVSTSATVPTRGLDAALHLLRNANLPPIEETEPEESEDALQDIVLVETPRPPPSQGGSQRRKPIGPATAGRRIYTKRRA